MFHFAFVGVCSQKELGGGGSVLDQSVSKNRVRSFLRGPAASHHPLHFHAGNTVSLLCKPASPQVCNSSVSTLSQLVSSELVIFLSMNWNEFRAETIVSSFP